MSSPKDTPAGRQLDQLEEAAAEQERSVFGRRRDLVRQKALMLGWRAMTAEGPALSSLASFVAGVEAYEDYLACHDRRGKR